MFWNYFRSPFPKAEGFSAYRMPGVAVHGPVILLFAWLGAWLCLGDPWLYALFLIYLVAGIYVGRDLAILAHYNPLITLAVLGGTIWLLADPPQWQRPSALASVAVTLAIALGLGLYAHLWTKLEAEGEPELHRLIRSRNLKAVERALDGGADPNEKGWNEYAPLHVAVELADAKASIVMVEMMVKRGADMSALCNNYGTPLGLAVEKGRTPVALRLLTLGADPNRFGKHGMPPLHVATRKGNREMLETLVAAGASLEAQSHGLSALDHAVLTDHSELIPWLLEKGAKPGPENRTLSFLAASSDPRAFELFQRVVDAGAAVTDRLLMDASTPEMIRFVAARGAKLESLLKEGKNPALIRRDTESRPERLRALRELGCDLAAADKYGRTILHDTSSYFEGVIALPWIMPELRGSGLDVNAADGEGATALHLMVKTLLPYVTGRNIVGLKSKLPVKDALELLDLLLEAGAAARLPGKDGKDAVALARELKAPRAFVERLEQGRSAAHAR